MATAERPTQVEAPKPQLAPGESLIEINPYLIELPLRAELPANGRKSSKPPSAGSCGGAVPADLLQAAKEQYGTKLPPAASSFCTALSQARQATISALHSTSASEAGVTEAVSAYLALLQGLTGPLSSASPGSVDSNGGAEAPGPSPSSPATAAAAAAEGAPMQAGNPPGKSSSPGVLDSALEFRHWDGFRAAAEAPGPRAGGAAFEAAQTLLSFALWKAAAAARAANRPSGDAVSSVQCAEAYRLMREAAGIAEELQKEPFQGAASRSGSSDLQPPLLAALSSCWLGDAESLTVARAIAKGSSPSVVAAVASDCAALYESAGRCPGDSDLHAKIRAYAAFKGAAMEGYAHTSNAQKLIDQDLAAEALRSSAEAADALRRSREAKAAFLKAPPKDSPEGHEAFERHLKNTVERAADRITRINSAVHYKAPATELPALPPPSRLAAAIPPLFPPRAPDALGLAEAIEGPSFGGGDGVPDPALAQGGGTGAGGGSKPSGGPPAATDDHQQPDEEVGCCCGALRWLLVLVAMPILLMASLVGVVVWIVLLPFKLPCCCCLGCLAQIVWDVVEWLIKAPAKGLLYASGKPWKPDPAARPRGGDGSDDAMASNV